MSEWQPIETAPKDDIDVLVLCGDDIFIGSFCGTMWWIEQTFYEKREPTHWMPLPKPLKPNKEEAAMQRTLQHLS
jgi:hypothetical protein